MLKESLRHLPESVKKVALRSDTAGYQAELLLYCGEGKDPRFSGAIEFAIGADVTLKSPHITLKEAKNFMFMMRDEPELGSVLKNSAKELLSGILPGKG